MHNFFIEKKQFDNDIYIYGSDVNHIKNVLRLQIMDKICVHIKKTTDKYLCEIIELNEKEVVCKVLEKIAESNESKVYINIIQSLPKSDKMELVIQKCTELGVSEFTPLQTNRCIVKINEKDEEKKIVRWQNIAEVAAKQCSRDVIPKVNKIQNINDLYEILKEYDLIVVLYENEKSITLSDVQISDAKKIAVIIGPEGGFEESEIMILKEYGYKIVTLGKRILRTETAPIAISSIILFIVGDLGGA